MNPIFVEYIWIDGGSPTQTLRSKTRVINSDSADLTGELISDPRYEWTFDGSSTMQADGTRSDCVLRPVSVFLDPIRPPSQNSRPHVLLLCEVYGAQGEPHPSNRRAILRKIVDLVPGSKDSWFGFEQEYTLFKGSRPLGFGEDRRFPAAQGPYYCGVGADEVFGRPLVEEHLEMCSKAGLVLTGINAEVMPGQWEFQVGGPGMGPISASDHLWVARWLLYRLGEKYGIHATLDPKPVPGDWNGAGMHTNFSTREMRMSMSEGFHSPGPGPFGISAIKKWCDDASLHVPEHLSEYGDGIEMRLTGRHETCSYREFRWGCSDRTASIRIPHATERDGCGYLEDRRPNANACPYRVAAAMLKTAYGLWGSPERGKSVEDHRQIPLFPDEAK
jgi:glutamine synthetase